MAYKLLTADELKQILGPQEQAYLEAVKLKEANRSMYEKQYLEDTELFEKCLYILDCSGVKHPSLIQEKEELLINVKKRLGLP